MWKTKLNTIATHYEILSQDHQKFTRIADSEYIEICDFSHISKSITVRIDRPKWFVREGELVINIFQDELRVASIAFSLAKTRKEIIAYIGAVQGIHSGISSEDSLKIYRTLTKNFFGLRPKSMLLEVLKVILHKFGAKRIFGVSDENRHHKHKYFAKNQDINLMKSYNAFWQEHSGVLDAGIGFFEVPMKPAIEDISKKVAKKRGQYRRRYAFINSIDEAINLN